MIQVLIGSLFILLALVALLLQRLYSFVPAQELKRLAREDDQLAKSFYRAASYGSSLRVLLWGTVVVGLSVGITLVIPQLNLLAAIVVLLVLLIVVLVAIPSMQLAPYNAWLPATVAPMLGWTLSYTNRFLMPVAKFLNGFRNLEQPGTLFNRQDLLRLLEQQAAHPSNRIATDELTLAGRALHFNSLHAADMLTPRTNLHMINADDAIGPILLDQLHKEGQGVYLVYQGNRDNIVGTLRLQDAIAAKQGGKVLEFIRPDVVSVPEESTIRELLSVFQKTGQRLVVVLNDFEELIGSITIDGLFANLFGTFEQHEQEPEQPSISPDTSPKETEVVE